jgi:hypothetical protein
MHTEGRLFSLLAEGEAMKTTAWCVIPLGLMFCGLLAVPPGWSAPPSPLDKYRNLKHRPTMENFNKGWEERVLVEFEIINSADLTALRAGLKDRDPFVRSIAARALGIRGDKGSTEALAELVRADPECMVRARAVESLGLLRMKPEAVELAKKDSNSGVQWVARMAAGQIQSETDYGAMIRKAYAVGIKRDNLAIAKVGQPAPDFTAVTSDGRPFKLSTVVGKKVIAIYFAAFDG